MESLFITQTLAQVIIAGGVVAIAVKLAR